MPTTAQQPFESYYLQTAHLTNACKQITGEGEADICIIGGGYTGLSAAAELAGAGAKVILLEAHKIGHGASGRNGGHLCVGQRKDQLELEQKLGLEKARQFWELGLEAATHAKSLIEREQIQCDLTPGIMHLAHKRSYVRDQKKEVEHMRNQYGYNSLQFIDRSTIGDLVASKNFFSGTLDTNAAHLHPLNFALGLKRMAISNGARLFENSAVLSVQQEVDSYRIKTELATIKAHKVIIACNGYLNKLAPALAGFIMPINNFVIATEKMGNVRAESLIKNRAAVSDSRFVVNYWRITSDNRLIFGGGENYRRNFPADIKGFVRRHMLKIYPQLADVKIESGWGGTLAISLNRMPVMGRLNDRLWYSLGYSGQGVAMATFAGRLIAESIGGNSERFELQASYPRRKFPGGTLLRWPGMVAGMLFYAARDRL